MDKPNFEETGPALKKKPVRKIKTIRTSKNITAVRAGLVKGSRRSACKLALFVFFFYNLILKIGSFSAPP